MTVPRPSLIVSLGLLSTPRQVVIILVGVVVLVAVHRAVLRAFSRIVGDSYPCYAVE